MKRRTFLSGAGAALTAGTAMPAIGRAQAATEIRIARQFSMSYLQFDVMDGRNLLQKHAKLLGLPEPKVTFNVFNGPDQMNNALLSGSTDVVMGGIAGLLTIWSKTAGTPQEVKAISALAQQPLLLLTKKPGINSITDFTDNDRIAVPAVKVSAMSLYLQMAAAKQWGPDKWDKLEPLTVSMSPPDSIAALESGLAGVSAIFSISPFQDRVVDQPGVKVILNSHDVFGGGHTVTCAWMSAKFREANPVLYKALHNALAEASDVVAKEPLETAKYWIAGSKSKLEPEFVAKIITKPGVKYTNVPEGTMKIAGFLTSTGMLKKAPTKWQDLFFPEVHDLKGS
jgi:NitT/TauT family transport system substrate-binding protein